ncbi:MAG: serine/threonine protein kinase, partial [Myxococcaceae bacterium]
LYETLTGRRAFDATNDFDAMKAALEHEVPPPSTFRSDIPRELDAIILQLMEKDVSRRTSNGGQLRAQLLSLQGPAAPMPYGQLLLAKAVKDAWTTLQTLKQPVVADVTEKSAGFNSVA